MFPVLRLFAIRAVLATVAATSSLQVGATEPESLFDGTTFIGWNGDIEKTWRIKNGAFVAGSPASAAPRNEFLATNREFENFELQLEYQMDCSAGCNAGVQFRSHRIPNHHEVIGYQADIAPGITGGLYDESRRNTMLGVPPRALQEKALALAQDGWHTYTVRAQGQRIQLAINGIPLLDYVEADDTIARKGMIALQIHGGYRGTIRYRNLRITELPAEATDEPTARPATP